MSYQLNFGNLSMAGVKPAMKKGSPFRIAILGDFSARANTGQLATGDDLAKRKPLKVDCDNLDDIIGRLNIKLTLPMGEGGSVEVAIGSMDDFHPDQLYSNVSLFGELAGLRGRLKTTSTFAKAAKEVQAWSGKGPKAKRRPPSRRARGSELASNASLNDFAQLVGRSTVKPAAGGTPIQDLLRQVVSPYIVPAKDPRQDAMLASVDKALSGVMCSVLHHPDFQTVESLWRSVDLLTRRLETDSNLQLVLLDVTAEELAADLSKAEDLRDSGLFKLLVEQPASDAHQGPYAAIVANYTFDRTPPHAELLGRVAKVVAQAPAAFLTAISSDCLDQKPDDLHPLIKDAWAALAGMSEAACLGLALPRFMLRLPYGKKTDPIDSFAFEEFTASAGLSSMLWGNPAVIAALLLGQIYMKQGIQMNLGSVLGVGDMPFHYFTDSDGDQVALPCTERLITVRLAALMTGQGFMPLMSMKGSPEVRLGGFGSIAGCQLAGGWKPPAPPKPAKAVPAPKPAPVEAEEPAPEAAEEPAPEAEAPAEAEAAAPAEESAAPVSTGDAELDALLAGTSSDSPAAEAAPADQAAAPADESPAPVSTGDPELDALLAGMSDAPAGADAAPAADAGAAPAEGDMDPELAKLLKDLGQ